MTSGIKGRSVLVTRPGGQAGPLLRKLAELDAVAIPFPVIEIHPLDLEAGAKQKVIDLDRYDLIILVSVNAVRFGMELVDQYWPQLPTHIQWYAVGAATAAALQNSEVEACVPEAGVNSEALLALPELQQTAGKRVLIMKGVGGRGLLAETLKSRGAEVEELDLYRRCKVPYSSEQIKARIGSQLPEIILVTSVEILESVDELLSPCYSQLMSVNLVAASERIARAAEKMGYRKVVTANSASDRDIIDTLSAISL